MKRGVVVGLVVAVLGGPASARAAEDPLRDAQWNLDVVHADDAHRVSVGAGVTVAVIDSGADLGHPDLAGRAIPGPDLVDGDGTPDDANGHGTNVAGIIGAGADNGVGILGAAPEARLLVIRALDATGRGTAATVARAIDAAVAAGAQVVNLSVTAGPSVLDQLPLTSELPRAVQRAADAGIVVVAAAGNNALPLCEQPVPAGRILCVGAVNRSLGRSSFSNFGLRVDLVAPGGEPAPDEAIVSTAPGGGYAAMAGTSQATPHVAAAAALLAELGVHGPEAIERILRTARDLGAPGVDFEFGAGLLDMSAAVAGLRAPAPGRRGTAQAPVGRPASANARPATTPVALAATVPRRARIATLLRRGLPVRCRVTRPARCAVRLFARGVVIARGARVVDTAATVRARPTALGRRMLRRVRRLAVVAEVTTTGATPVRRSAILVR